jgi:predicted hydrocarbon binding protein
MKSAQQKTLYYPNNMGRIVLLAITDILGDSGLNVILNFAGLSWMVGNLPPNTFDLQFEFGYISKIMKAIESYYGPHGGRGLALRTGRACFKYGLREFGPVLGVSDLAFRLLPLATKITVGAEKCAQVFNQYTDQRVRLEATDDKIYWHIDSCPVCWQRSSESPCCHLAVGVLQEGLYWLSGGKNFQLEEVACIAQGASSCTIEIIKQPMS